MFLLGVILSALFQTKFAIYDDAITRKFVEQIAVLNQVPLSWAGGRQKPELTAVQVQIPLLRTLPHGPDHPTEAVKSVRQGGKKISSHLGRTLFRCSHNSRRLGSIFSTPLRHNGYWPASFFSTEGRGNEGLRFFCSEEIMEAIIIVQQKRLKISIH